MDSPIMEPSLVDYSRQAEFDESIRNFSDNVVIIGCGGIGFWLGILLSMTGNVKKLTIFDKDKIEATNLNRIPVPQTWLGKSKVSCLKAMIHMLRPDISVVAVPNHVTEDTQNILKGVLTSDYVVAVVDTTDDARAQKMIYGIVKEMQNNKNLHYVKVGYEGNTVGAVKVLNAWIPDDYRPGYRTTNANAITSAVAAGFGLYKLLLGNEVDMKLDLKEFVNSPQQEGVKKKSTKKAPETVRTVPHAPTDTTWAVDNGADETGEA